MKKDNKKKGGFMKIPREMAYSPDYTVIDKMLYAVLDDRYDYREKMGLLNDGYMTVKVPELVETLEISKPTIIKSLRKMCENGIILKKEDKKNAPNEYKILNYDAVNEIIAKKAGKEIIKENNKKINKKTNNKSKSVPKSPMHDAYEEIIRRNQEMISEWYEKEKAQAESSLHNDYTTNDD